MIRNLKVLGLALVAVFAMSAMAASAASASALTSDGAVKLVGYQTGGAGANKLTFGTLGTECRAKEEAHEPQYTGFKYNETPHGLIPSGATTTTIEPEYGVCSALGLPATVDMNGCDYVFHLGAETSAHKYAVKSDVVCPESQHIKVTVYGSAAKHTNNEPLCVVTITQNETGYNGLTATDTTNGEIDITGTVEGISADKSSPTGSILCPTQTTNAATLVQDVTVVGQNSLGEPTNISLS